MGTYSTTEPSNFDGVISIIDQNFVSRKGSSKKVNFIKILEEIYSKYKHFKSFKGFDSLSDFKFKILAFYNKRRNSKKRNKQKIPPGVRSWERFWEEW